MLHRFFNTVLTEYRNQASQPHEYFYVWFNWLEGFLWFAIALYVLIRFLINRRSPVELCYVCYLISFGITDLMEVTRLTVGLLAVKGLVLLGILVCRHYTLQAYFDRNYKF